MTPAEWPSKQQLWKQAHAGGPFPAFQTTTMAKRLWHIELYSTMWVALRLLLLCNFPTIFSILHANQSEIRSVQGAEHRCPKACSLPLDYAHIIASIIALNATLTMKPLSPRNLCIDWIPSRIPFARKQEATFTNFIDHRSLI